mmetsp:Transcript_44239/g.116261  ORF Transcript_44239/g.116261 Transcript_44239/m.116261 type:complete len:210 (-) Transcript_44239:101-730(-)
MSASPVSSSSIVSSLGATPSASDLGFANLTWYERPDALCTHLPQMRSVRTSSGTSRASTRLTLTSGASISSSILACSTVRGKPSRINPFAQSSSLMRSRIIDTTSSSETRPPEAITSFACMPTSEPAATAARSMSPVDSCGISRVSTILGACEPFPAPGGPKRIMTVLESPAIMHASSLVRPPRAAFNHCTDDNVSTFVDCTTAGNTPP